MDALLLTVLDQVVALEDGVALNLVSSGNNTSTVDDSLKLLGMVSWCKDNLDSCEVRTCSIVWLETPTERALLLGSWVIAKKRQFRAFFKRHAKD